MGDIPEPFQKCLAILSAAKDDTERFAALFMVTKLIKSSECTPQIKKLLLEGIGFKFFKRLLTSQDSSDCPAQIYKSVALSILSFFYNEPELAVHPEMLSYVPVLLDIVQQGDADDFDDNLVIVSEAYECLEHIVNQYEGKKVLFEAGAISKMSDIYSQQVFQSDSALRILETLVNHFGSSSWDSSNPKSFHALMNKFALDFETDNSERKFELCETMKALLMSCPKSFVENLTAEEFWPRSIFKGLNDILRSKIGKAQRDPALKLASVMIDVMGIEWTLTNESNPKQFFLLLVHLCSVEVRMQMEDRSLDQIFKNADLLSSCFLSLELAMSHIGSESLDLDEKEKQQLYTALKGGFTAIIHTLARFSPDIAKGKVTLTVKNKLFMCAVLRVLAAWLAQETSAMREVIYSLLPFIFSFSNETFYSYRARYIAEKVQTESKSGLSSDCNSPGNDPISHIDILRLMLPAMTHLTIENEGRQIMLKCKEDQVLLDCLTFHWSIVHYVKPVIPKCERLKQKKENEVPLSPVLVEEMKLSRTAMINLCNIFMNITVLEPKLAEEGPVMIALLKFILNNLPELKNCEENLVLHGNMAVLGLLLLKQQASKVKKNDFSICRYIQSAIRFLWDAYVLDESAAYPTLIISMPYKKNWIELMELWFLGMQTMSTVLTLIPWISEFALESGWALGMLENVKYITRHKKDIPANTKSAYEDLLCNLVDANPSVADVLRQHDALSVCKSHHLMELGKRLFGD